MPPGFYSLLYAPYSLLTSSDWCLTASSLVLCLPLAHADLDGVQPSSYNYSGRIIGLAYKDTEVQLP